METRAYEQEQLLASLPAKYLAYPAAAGSMVIYGVLPATYGRREQVQAVLLCTVVVLVEWNFVVGQQQNLCSGILREYSCFGLAKWW